MFLDQVGRADLVHAGAGTKEEMALRVHAKFWPGQKKPAEHVVYLNDCYGEDDDCFRRVAPPLQWPKGSAAEDTGASGLDPPGQQRPNSSKLPSTRMPSAEMPSAESSHPGQPPSVTPKLPATRAPPPPAPPPRGEAANSQSKRPKSLGNPNNPSPAPRAAKAALVHGTKEHWLHCIDEFSKHAGDDACPNSRLFFPNCI